MRYTRLATYDMVKGTFPELVSMADKGILPIFAREPGFVDYGLIDAGQNKVVSISIWETREQAQKAVDTPDVSERVRVGQMPAVPRHEKVAAVVRGQREMEGVTGRVCRHHSVV